MTDPLNTAVFGTPDFGTGDPVVILHGLFGSSRNWRSIGQALAARYRVIAVDLPNHGASPWSDRMDYETMAQAVRHTLRANGIVRCALIGHSMGGKTAMTLALRHPDEISRLVVVDIAPAANPTRHLDYVRAMRALDLSAIARRGEADMRLAAAVADAPERAFLLQNLELEQGRFRWRINLPIIEQQMPCLVGWSPPPPGSAYPGPTLFVAGRNSDYVRPEYEPEIRRLFPEADIAWIENAGHWLHAEQPQEFLRVVEAFLGGTA